MEALKKKTLLILSTFFYIGYLPLIPGTFGSMAGLCLYFIIKDSTLIYALATALLLALGFLVSGPAERLLNKKDARCIVIDEVAGMLLSLAFLPYDLRLAIIGFFLFRILDSLKPYPAGPLQNLKGSFGIMSDDIIAGLYTNIILQIVVRSAVFKGL